MALGIENLKKLVKFPLDLTNQITDSLSNGWQFTDLFSFIDELASIPGIVKTWKDISAELRDLDLSERQELYAYIVEEFDIPNDQVEAFVEDALKNVVSLISLYERFKSLKK